MRKLTLTALLAVAVAGTSAAAAADPVTVNEWRVVKTSETGTPISIVSGSDEEAGVMVSCRDDKLVAAVGFGAGDIAKRLQSDTNRLKSRAGQLTIGDRDEERARWIYYPQYQLAQTVKSVTAKKIYNAAIRGDAISLNLQRKGITTIQLPAMNDNFKAFAKACTVTG